jgi:hypothetical protein
MNITFLPVVRVSHIAFEIPLIFGFAYGSSDCVDALRFECHLLPHFGSDLRCCSIPTSAVEVTQIEEEYNEDRSGRCLFDTVVRGFVEQVTCEKAPIGWRPSSSYEGKIGGSMELLCLPAARSIYLQMQMSQCPSDPRYWLTKKSSSSLRLPFRLGIYMQGAYHNLVRC